MASREIPAGVRAVVAQVIGAHLYNHGQINRWMQDAGAPGESPEGSCVVKIEVWLGRCNKDPAVDALAVLGRFIERFMDVPRGGTGLQRSEEDVAQGRAEVVEALKKNGLAYEQGRIRGAASRMIATRSLEERLKLHDFTSVEEEFERAKENEDRDPRAALTSARAIVESVCAVYIEDQGLELPKDRDIGTMWKIVRTNLGLDPAGQADKDVMQILSGLISIVSGIATFRTHAGSAHGHGRAPYTPQPRHARLAIGASHTLVNFVIETWTERRKPKP